MSEGMPVKKVSAEMRKQYEELGAAIEAEANEAKGRKKAFTSQFPVTENFDDTIDLCQSLNKNSIMETYDPPEGSKFSEYSVKLTLSVTKLSDEQLERRKRKGSGEGDAAAEAVEVE